MSGFLDSLVARSFGRPPAIRPRLASLFEPARGNVAEFRAPAWNAAPREPAAIEEIEPQAVVSHESPDSESETSPAPEHRAPRMPVLTVPDRASNVHADSGAELTGSVENTSATETAHGGLGPVQVSTRMFRQKPKLAVADSNSNGNPDSIPGEARESESLRDAPDREPVLVSPLRRTLRKKPSAVGDLAAAGPAENLSVPGEITGELDRHETRSRPEAPLAGRPITDSRAVRVDGGFMRPAPFEISAGVVTQVPGRMQGPMNPPGPATDKQSLDNGNARNEQNTMLVPPPGYMRLFNTMTGPIVAGDRRESMATAQAQTEPEPSIQVTIGRIEIRAETAGASARKTERVASPVMGLEEYLRGQGKRGRG